MGNHDKRVADPDPTVCVMASRKFTVDDVLGMCYNCDLVLSADESEGEEIHAYCGQRVIQPEEVWRFFSELSFLTRLVAQLALSRTV